jgi:Holliday junction resolvasome RuvABC ATP-dependent DNA helicase subunit
MENVEAITAGTVTADDVTINALEETLYLQGLDPIIGLDRPSRSYLQVLAKDSTLLGANAIAVMIGEQEEVITSVIEPFLLSSVEATAKVSGKTVNIAGALAERTPHGRAITETGVQYLQYCKELQETAGWFPGEKL